MAEIERKDLISDEALQAPLTLAENFEKAYQSVEKLVKLAKKSEEAISANSGSTSSLAKETSNLAAAQTELDKIQKQYAVSTQKLSDEYVKTKRAVDDVNKASRELVQTEKDKIALDGQDSKNIDAKTNSIKQLELALKKNRDAYKELSTEEQRLSKEGQELLSIIQNQDKQVKALNGSIGKHTDSMGDYRGQLQTLFPVQTAFVTGIWNAIKASLAFIATPLGATIAALALAFALLKNEINNNDEAADELERRTAQLNASLNLMKRNIDLVVAALIGVPGAMTALKVSLGFVQDESKKLTARQQELEDATNILILKEGKLINQRDQLVQQSKNKKITDEEAIELNKRAAAIDEALTNVRIQLATKKAQNVVETVGLEFGIRQKLNESLDAYAERIIRNTNVNAEEGKKVADAIRAIYDVQNTSIKLQEKLDNQRDARDEKIAALAQKRLEQKKKEADEENALQEKQEQFESRRFIEEQSRKRLEIIESEKAEDRKVKMVLTTQKILQKANADYAKTSDENAKKQIQQDALNTSLRLQIAGSYVRTIGGLLAQNASDEKEAATIKKTAAIIEIGINLQRVLSANAVTAAANPLNVVTFGAAGATQLALLNGLAIAQAIAMSAAVLAFKKGTKSAPGGPSIVGEEGMELITHGDKATLSPSSATLVNLPKGAKVFTHAETMKILALSGFGNSVKVDDKQYILYDKLSALQSTFEEYTGLVVKAVENSGGQLIEQGSQLYHHQKKVDGSRKITRLKSMTS